MLSVEMKSTMSILKNLEWYVQGDNLDGDNKYMCETCIINGLSKSRLPYLIRKKKGWPWLKQANKSGEIDRQIFDQKISKVKQVENGSAIEF